MAKVRGLPTMVGYPSRPSRMGDAPMWSKCPCEKITARTFLSFPFKQEMLGMM